MSTLKYLKGSSFINRYKVTGHLVTKTPLHIGSGLETRRQGLTKQNKQGEDEQVKVSAIAIDVHNQPYLPGSTLRGNVRSWLLHLLRCLPKSQSESGETLAWDRDFDALAHDARYQKQEEQIDFMKNSASVLERLFGTPFAASKIDFWDAPCVTSTAQLVVPAEISKPDRPPYWSEQRRTYVTQSVAIDPNTGAAADEKLYHFEVVPKGVMFRLTVCGQNLTDLELGMLLLGLEAFNSAVFPVTLGAMSNRGFGTFDWNLQDIYLLDRDNLSEWLLAAISLNNAGYESLKPLGDRKTALMQSFTGALKEALEDHHGN